jgi:heme-degrading monooxygenase HmoA
VLVVTRFDVPEPDEASFLAEAQAALTALGGRPGYRGGRVGRAVEDPTTWVVQSEWEHVGAYRRALSAYDVKVHAAPLLGRARNEVSAYEVLWSDERSASTQAASARALDADTAAPGRDI